MPLLIIFIIFFGLSCSRSNWNEDVKNTKTVCEVPECSLEKIEEICSNYPYIGGTEIEPGLWENLECVFCGGDHVTAKKVNDFCKNKKGEKR